MTGAEFAIFCFFGAGALGLACRFGAGLLTRFAAPGELEVAAFIRERVAAGWTPAQAQDELRLRETMARLRRLSSAAVELRPDEWIAILEREKLTALESLKDRPDLAQRFGEAVAGLPFSHILYGRAADLVRARLPEPPPLRVTPDTWAATRIVPPA